MATREMTDEQARQEIAIVHAALNATIQELEGQGMHSATILEVLIGLAVQSAVEDWGLEGAREILSGTMNARLADEEGLDEPRH
jgi:hypothetical protein